MNMYNLNRVLVALAAIVFLAIRTGAGHKFF